ncbi:MAG: hypothetical protein ABWZ76_03270 [Acidimicrobiales bacterium]
MRDLPSFPAPTLTIRPWPDPVIDELGHDARSEYVERFWLGVLGPTAIWLLRRLATGLEQQPEGFELDLATTAVELGVGSSSGKHSPFVRTIQRCCRFGLLEPPTADTLRVRRKLPPLTRSQVERLPAHLQQEHHAWVERARPPAAPLSELRERARGFALSLLSQGAPGAAIERELHRRGIHPALAHEAVTWAVSHETASRAPAQQDDLPPAA